MTTVNTSAVSVPRITVIDPHIPERAKLRVAAYARVSSDTDDQINSYIAQVDFYSKYISAREDWELVDIYADEGITGLEARKRDDFNRMMEDCRTGKIDRVLVKSISRFSRNTKEYIQFVRELLRLGISIHFEKENIDTGKMTTEQIAQIYGAFAQMESTNHSGNMRTSMRIRMEKGLFVPPTAPYGYRLVGRDLEIVPEEAQLVRWIYDAYLNGKGKDDIANELNRLGADRGHNREKWYPSTVNYILTNISYLGAGGYPRLVEDRDFLTVRLRRESQTTYTPYPPALAPIREKAVCAVCGAGMKRDTKRHGHPRWHCQNPGCGHSLYMDDELLVKQVEERVRRLAQMPLRFKAPTAAAPSMDAVRIENELKLCFNRAELNPEYIETLIFAAAAERYRELPDPAPRQKGIERGRQAQENPLDGKRLWDFFDVAVSAVRMGQKCLELELAANVTIQTREEEPA